MSEYDDIIKAMSDYCDCNNTGICEACRAAVAITELLELVENKPRAAVYWFKQTMKLRETFDTGVVASDDSIDYDPPCPECDGDGMVPSSRYLPRALGPAMKPCPSCMGDVP